MRARAGRQARAGGRGRPALRQAGRRGGRRCAATLRGVRGAGSGRLHRGEGLRGAAEEPAARTSALMRMMDE
jgi:hypothetical protein